MPYVECATCAEVLLEDETELHIRNFHNAIIDVLVNAGRTEAEAIADLVTACQPTAQAPVPTLVPAHTMRVRRTTAQKFGIDPSFANMEIGVVAGGSAMSMAEYEAMIEETQTVTSWPVDAARFLISLSIYLIHNDASDRSEDGGFTVYSSPQNVVAAAAGARVVSEHFLTATDLRKVGAAACRQFGREFTLRRLGRCIYPIIYENRNAQCFSELNDAGNSRTVNLGLSPTQWYLTVSFIHGVSLKTDEKTIKAIVAQKVGPIDAAKQPAIVDSTPQTLASAKASAEYNQILSLSGINHIPRGSGSI